MMKKPIKFLGLCTTVIFLSGCSAKPSPAKFAMALGQFNQSCKPHFSDFDKLAIGAAILQQRTGMNRLSDSITNVKTNYAKALDYTKPLKTRYSAISSANHQCKDLARASKVAKMFSR